MIQMIINRIGTDKLLHILFSMLLVLELRRIMPGWAAGLSTIFLGVLKELYDKISGRGTAEWKDLLADCIGIILGML